MPVARSPTPFPPVFLLVAALVLSSTAAAQQRVVSVGGDLTEIIYALGEGDRLVASDDTSVFPPDALDMPKVGYVRRLSAEGVLSVEPDLLLISGAAGPREALQLLRASGVPIIEMEEAYSIDAIVAKTRRVAEVLDVPEAGERLVERIEADWASARQAIDPARERTMLFFAAPPGGAILAAGRETAAHAIIRMLGARNVFDDYSGYKPLSLEAAVAADPDVILVMQHHADAVGGYEAVVGHPALSLTEAARQGRVYLVDQVAVMQFGPRAPAAIAQLAQDIEGNLVAQHER